MQALSSSMRMKMPVRPSSPTTPTANSTIGSVIEARTRSMRRRRVAAGAPPTVVGLLAVAVPLFDTATPLEPLRQALRDRAVAVLDSGRYILGPEVDAFESELAAYLGVPHVIGVANGTDALTIALRAMGVGPGDDVVVPSFTFYASAEAIPPTGARPVFCDVDPDTFCVTADTVQRRADAADQGRDRRRPVRQRGAGGRRSRRWGCRCWRTPPRQRGPRCTAGARLAGHRGHAFLLPLQEPGRVRRRRGDRHRRLGPGRERRGCCASTARATR